MLLSISSKLLRIKLTSYETHTPEGLNLRDYRNLFTKYHLPNKIKIKKPELKDRDLNREKCLRFAASQLFRAISTTKRNDRPDVQSVEKALLALNDLMQVAEGHTTEAKIELSRLEEYWQGLRTYLGTNAHFKTLAKFLESRLFPLIPNELARKFLNFKLTPQVFG